MLNARKSQVMIVSPSGYQEKFPEVAIKCRGQSLPQVASAKYLGRTITNDLSWTVHISNVANKAAGKIGALARSKNNLTFSARKQFYSAVIRTDLLYASNAFSGNLSSANIYGPTAKISEERTSSHLWFTSVGPYIAPRYSLS